MFASMLLIDGAVLFVVYGLIVVLGSRGSLASFALRRRPRQNPADIGDRHRTTRRFVSESTPGAPGDGAELRRYSSRTLRT